MTTLNPAPRQTACWPTRWTAAVTWMSVGCAFAAAPTCWGQSMPAVPGAAPGSAPVYSGQPTVGQPMMGPSTTVPAGAWMVPQGPAAPMMVPAGPVIQQPLPGQFGPGSQPLGHAPVGAPAAAYGPATGYGASGVMTAGGMVQPAAMVQLPVQPVQNSADSARALHHLIEAMPTPQEDMELIERRSQLMLTKANVTRYAISDPSVLDIVQFSPKELSLLGLARGSTTLTMWFEGHADPIIYTVKTIRDPALDSQRRSDYGRLERQINTLFPNSKVYLIPLSWKVIVRGQARNQEEAAHIMMVIRDELMRDMGGFGGFGNAGGYFGQGGFGGGFGGDFGGGFLGGGFNQFGFINNMIVNELRIPGEYQIQLRVRVAEVNRSRARNLGIDINVLFANARQAVFTNLGAAGAATIGGLFEDGEIGIFLQFLQAHGTAKLLTEPQLVVLSGRTARFLAGGEFAVPTVVGIGGATGQTTSFRGFGTSLLVTPTVEDRDLIRISALAEYSDLNAANAVGGIPGTNSRRIETTVEMREGQTLALAGLLRHQQKTIVTEIPYLSSIPKIGPILFASKQSTLEESELLILITPEIVRPMDAHEVPPVPGFEITHPQDTEFYKYNMVEGSPDTGYYQVPPYGSGSVGTNVGYQHFNPGPASSMYSPVPTNPNGTGFSTPTPIGSGIPSGPGTAVPPATVPPPPPRNLPSYSQPQNGNGSNRGNGVDGTNGNRNVQPIPDAAMRQGRQTSQTMPTTTTPQNGWTRPAATPQTIVPSNYSVPASQKTGNQARVSRDTSGSNRY